MLGVGENKKRSQPAEYVVLMSKSTTWSNMGMEVLPNAFMVLPTEVVGLKRMETATNNHQNES